MRRIRGYLIAACAVILAGGTLFAFRKQIGGILPPIVRRSDTSISEALLVKVRDICAIHTVEYVYKAVFPHDFLPAGMNYKLLFRLKELGRNLSAEDKDAIRVFEICTLMGLNPERAVYDFFVITARVRAGFDLTDSFFSSGNPAQSFISLSEDGTVTVSLPQAVITEFVIEDSNSSTYLYPDMKISPEHWRLATDFASQKIRDRVIAQGILEKAEQNGKAIIERMLINSGVKAVQFKKEAKDE